MSHKIKLISDKFTWLLGGTKSQYITHAIFMKKKLYSLTLIFLFFFCGNAAYGDSLGTLPEIHSVEMDAVEQSLYLEQASSDWEEQADTYDLKKIKEFIKIHEIQVSRFHTGEEVIQEDIPRLPNGMQELGSILFPCATSGSNPFSIQGKPKSTNETIVLLPETFFLKPQAIISNTDRKIKYIHGMSHYGPPIRE